MVASLSGFPIISDFIKKMNSSKKEIEQKKDVKQVKDNN